MARTKAPPADDVRFAANYKKMAIIDKHIGTTEGLTRHHQALDEIRREEEKRIDAMNTDELIAYSRGSELISNLTAPAQQFKVKSVPIPKQLDLLQKVMKKRDQVKAKAGIWVKSVTEHINDTLMKLLADSTAENVRLKQENEELQRSHFGNMFETETGEANGPETEDEGEVNGDERIQHAISTLSATFKKDMHEVGEMIDDLGSLVETLQTEKQALRYELQRTRRETNELSLKSRTMELKLKLAQSKVDLLEQEHAVQLVKAVHRVTDIGDLDPEATRRRGVPLDRASRVGDVTSDQT
ncbi:hypothetical protein FKW77_000994 [Venturia effusa]|uniref:Uncharacterized protein n=1 Tax=Venturia effusa TaxID=50376 RepID=A0A517L4V2_9PEZI|nr:hypothetical protein FKW77_000994 [Venturia effusa]